MGRDTSHVSVPDVQLDGAVPGFPEAQAFTRFSDTVLLSLTIWGLPHRLTWKLSLIGDHPYCVLSIRVYRTPLNAWPVPVTASRAREWTTSCHLGE